MQLLTANAGSSSIRFVVFMSTTGDDAECLATEHYEYAASARSRLIEQGLDLVDAFEATFSLNHYALPISGLPVTTHDAKGGT
jgi:acetate kinase